MRSCPSCVDGIRLSREEPADGRRERVSVAVMCSVPGAVDDDDATVLEAGIEGKGRLAEDRKAVATEDLEDGLADLTEDVDRGRRVSLRLELAEDRACSGGADRPDRVGAIRLEVGRGHADDFGDEGGPRAVSVTRRKECPEPVLDARRVVAGPGGCRGALVRHDTADGP